MTPKELKLVQNNGKFLVALSVLSPFILMILILIFPARWSVILFWALPGIVIASIFAFYGNQMRQAAPEDSYKLRRPVKIMMGLVVLAMVGSLLNHQYPGLVLDGFLLVLLSRSAKILSARH